MRRRPTDRTPDTLHPVFLRAGDPPVLRLLPHPWPDPEVVLELEKSFPYGPDDPYVSGMVVRVLGPHVRLEEQIIVLSPGALGAWVRGLYDEFRGWDGERTWRSPDDDLRITARHDGHVHLTWSVSHVVAREVVWTFTTTTHHDAGEDVRHLADDLDALLGGA